MKSKALLLLVIAVGLIGCGSGVLDKGAVQEAKEEFQIEIELSNDCTDTSECIIVYPGCPLGCGAAVNVNYEDSVEEKAQEIIDSISSGGVSCDYSCVQPVAQCVDRKCEAVFN